MSPRPADRWLRPTSTTDSPWGTGRVVHFTGEPTGIEEACVEVAAPAAFVAAPRPTRARSSSTGRAHSMHVRWQRCGPRLRRSGRSACSTAAAIRCCSGTASTSRPGRAGRAPQPAGRSSAGRARGARRPHPAGARHEVRARHEELQAVEPARVRAPPAPAGWDARLVGEILVFDLGRALLGRRPRGTGRIHAGVGYRKVNRPPVLSDRGPPTRWR